MPFYEIISVDNIINIDNYKRMSHEITLKGTSGIILEIDYVSNANIIDKIFQINYQEKLTTDLFLKNYDKAQENIIQRYIGKIDKIYVNGKIYDTDFDKVCRLHGVEIKTIDNLSDLIAKKIIGCI